MSISRLGIAVAIIFVITQVLIPGYLLTQPRPQRFSWQMYSGVRTPAEFMILRTDGSEEPVEVTDYLAYPRLDSDYSESLPRYICEQESGVAGVRVENRISGDTWMVSCT